MCRIDHRHCGRSAAVVLVAVLTGVGPSVVALGDDTGTGSAAMQAVCPPDGGKTARVADIIDGDTLMLADGQVVRLVAIEAPKTYLARPGADVAAVADAARRALEQLAGGKSVKISDHEPAIDRHGRVLAALTLDDGTWLQEALAYRGFVRVRPFSGEDSCLDRLRAAERDARTARRGLWRQAEYSVISAYDPSLIDRKGLYVVVEGRVISVGHGERVDFLNFGHVWRRDFTVLVGASTAARLADAGRATDTMVGKRVRVRGIIEESGGPAIRLNDPGEIEILDD